MLRKKKKLTDLKDSDVIKKLLPKELIEKAKKVAHERDNPKPLKKR